MVGDHLLTREVILARLQSPAVDDALYRWVAGRLESWLKRDFAGWAAALPPAIISLWWDWWNGGRGPAALVVEKVLAGPDSEARWRAGLTRLLLNFGDRNLRELFDDDDREGLRRRLPRLIDRLLAAPRLKDWLEQEFEDMGRRLLLSPKPLAELLPADLQTALLAELHRELPDLLLRFSRLLHDPEIRSD